MTQMAGVTTIAIGVVFVLLLGEIDLSIGYVARDRGRRRRPAPDPRRELAGERACSRSRWPVTVTPLIGGLQGSFVAFLGVPSFVVTLAGLLFWQGVILYVIGGAGVIVIEDSTINNLANYYFSATPPVAHRRRDHVLYRPRSRSAVMPPRVVSRRTARDRQVRGLTSRSSARSHLHPLSRPTHLRRADLGELPSARLPARLPAHDHLPRLLDVARRADDVRPARLRRRRERRGGAAGRHQRAADPRPRLHDLAADGRDGRRDLRRAPQLGRPQRRRRHAPARRDLRSRDRRRRASSAAAAA